MTQAAEQSTSGVDADPVLDALREIIDPEVGLNIVDLGLIYAIEARARAIRVRMTMTTPFCPMGGMLTDEVRAVVAHRFPVRRIDVDLVWEPRWQPDMVSPIARLEFGLNG
jgi:metal-sulfur cluster biosynthetic enzyme